MSLKVQEDNSYKFTKKFWNGGALFIIKVENCCIWVMDICETAMPILPSLLPTEYLIWVSRCCTFANVNEQGVREALRRRGCHTLFIYIDT